jgi:hypothetical protein
VLRRRPRHNGEDRDAEIALYVDARYFCVTGHAWGDYDSLEDVTESVLWLAGRLADFKQQRMPAAFESALATDEYLQRLWTAGEHAGGDKSRSAADAALANALSRRRGASSRRC